MADGDVAAAWFRYRDAIGGIYDQPPGAIFEIADAQLSSEPDDLLLEHALIRSDELRAVILAELLSSNSSGKQRELALTQLAAAAAIDLSIANNLARLTPEETDSDELPELDEPPATVTFADAALVLEAVGDDPWGPILAGGAGPQGGPRGALMAQANSVTNSVIDEVRDVVVSAAGGFIGAGMTNLVMTSGAATEHIFHGLTRHVGRVRRAAINFALNAVKKLFAFLGVNAVSVHNAVSFFVERQVPELVRYGLTILYSEERIAQELGHRISAAPTEQAMGAAEVELAELRRRFAKNMEITGGAVHALNKVKRWLFHVAPPHSHLAVTTAYAVATGFAVSAGGDYLDSSPIDFVPGIQTIVRGAT